MQKAFTHTKDVQIEELEVTYQSGSRFYQSPNGEKYPSVTTVTGWEKNEFFAKWRAENPKESKRVLNRGNFLHDLIERYLNNEDINLLSESPTVASLFVQMKDTLENIDNIHALEVPLWSATLGLAGRVDCVAEYNGELSIIDFKGSTRQKRKSDIGNYMLQATAYAIMWHEMTGKPIHKFNILMATEDSCTPQVFGGNPVDYVQKLYGAIKYYKKETSKVLINE